MRLIGHIESDKDARTFGDFLYVQGIENEAERDGNRWAIWVHSDDQIPVASKLLEEFRASPNDARFLAGSPAEKLREQAKARDEAYQKRVVSGKKLFPGLTSYGFGFVTYALILASAAIFLLSQMGDDLERLSLLLIQPIEVNGDMLSYFRNWSAVRHGEVWRLLTPIMIHFGFPHILFNMLWLRDLGSMFEARLSSSYLFVFVVVVAAASNAAQYFFTGQPVFGGMSGVNYALLGYVWIRGRFDPGAGLHIDRQSLLMSLIFFGLCFTPLIPRVANYVHVVGLVLGMAWAFVDSKRK
jgi:GlpG protein